MIWIRITKSVGESTQSFLQSTKLKEDVLIVTPCVHNAQYVLFQKEYKRNPKVFSVIRDPYDKALSAYKWLVHNPLGNARCADIFDKGFSFRKFLKRGFELREEFDTIRNVCVTLDHKERGNMWYQKYWVVSHLESSFDSINFFIPPRKVTLVPLEELSSFIHTLSHEADKFPSKKNKSEHKKKHLNRKDKRIVEKYYEKDFALYKNAIKTFEVA